ncbi:toprim domain-containing protein [Nocardia huaxiensis]|uniref:Toprim domain-containing protein n=1 Tax=Nocardia huaxiensis TaxID=2755382 RepID=A0A7D6ZS56_9NOCA|nr:toprim domain-containing protein [Nocardia huaxiensis]QLY34003.1 toprim domain-containing protein [Nocardia huaxiensis]UFS99094.1 toprim domain-containing protein [Nocardia huaxiensis]
MEPQASHGRSWQLITSALTARMGPGKPGTRWTLYLCPVHEADGQHHNPSLGVRYDPAQAKTIVRCFAHCDDVDVLASLDLQVRDMWDRLPDRNPNQPNRRQETRTPPSRTAGMSLADKAIDYAAFPRPEKPDLGAPVGPAENVEAYVYRWANGSVEGAVTRTRTPHERGEAKGFWQARWTGTNWERTGFAPIPFRLPEVVDAVNQGRDIYVVEGEKDVQRAHAAGLVATCNAMGAGSWTREHAAWLAGATRVIVVADYDRPGYRHADKVAQSLHGQVGEVRVLQAAVGKDLSDHLDAGLGVDDLAMVPYLDRHYRQPITQQRPVTRSR